MKGRALFLVTLGVLVAMTGSILLASTSLGLDVPGSLVAQVRPGDLGGAGDQPTNKKEKKSAKAITAEGTLTPLNYGKLGFKVGGRVVEIPLQADDTFQAGQPVARLDSAELDLAVQAAEDNLGVAEASLEQLKQSARPESSNIAQANVAAAEARLARLRSGARAEEIAQAEAGVQAAEAQLAKLLNGPTSQQLRQAEIGIKKAKNNLYYQQAARDYANSKGMAPISQDQGEALVGIAYEDLALAQAQMDALKEPAREEDVAQAKAAVEAARQKLELARTPVTQEQIAEAEAAVEAARQQARLAKSPYTDGDLAVAQARVKQAETALSQAKVARDNAVLVAPYAGTVADVLVRSGEMVQPGQPVVVFANLSDLVVKTTDLDETSATKVKIGQRAAVTLNAFDDKLVYGKVTAIAPMATVAVSEDVNYVATIKLDQQDPALLWGMTTKVEFLRD